MNTRTISWTLIGRFTPLFKIFIFSTTLLTSSQIFAKEDVNTELVELKKQLKQLKEQQLQLEEKLEDIENTQSKAQAFPVVQSTVASNNDLLKIGLSGLFSSGYSSVNDEALESLQAGGHDPNRNGFNVQNVELSVISTVDPYFDAQANIIFLIDQEGETVVELEEAFFTSRALSAGLQVKGGQYYTEFGRFNPQHPHQWSFVDQPIVISRLFGGDGLRSQGARVAWLMPTDWYSEIYFGAQNANGETVTSFLFEEGEDIAGHILGEKRARSFNDALLSFRWLNSFDFSDNSSLNFGISGLSGPNSSGTNNDTSIYGVDAYFKWQPDYVQRGYPFVSWHTEWLTRRYEAGENIEREILKDTGFFSQVLWGFQTGWELGLRFEKSDSNGDDIFDPFRNDRERISTNLTWRLSEYSKLRLQYNRDWADHLEENTADSLILQMEFSLGSHMAHKF